MGKTEILAAMNALKLTIATEFVPFSKSRHATPAKGEKPWRCLNWRVTLKHDGRDVVTTDYSAGEGHCPGSKDPRLVDLEIHTGLPAYWPPGQRHPRTRPDGKPILPDPCDVIASLALDSDVIDAGGFESWAEEFGYDTDSRKAEATYRACLELALKLRSALGDDGLRTLREACQDY